MLRLVLEYDGTDFHGWQAQPSIRTVEGVVRDALFQVTGEEPRLSAAGRTDAGAHAHGQVVGVPLSRELEPARLSTALNAVLPRDVAVRRAEPVADQFHARFDALSRTYRYVVASRDIRAPLLRRYSWQITGDLDVEAMRNAAALLRGTHDFGAFGRSPHPGGNTVRTVDDVSLRRVAAPDVEATTTFILEVRANAFLRGMMRAIAGAVVSVGLRRMTVDHIAAMLADPGAAQPVTVAPARGLHQWSVTYPVAGGTASLETPS